MSANRGKARPRWRPNATSVVAFRSTFRICLWRASNDKSSCLSLALSLKKRSPFVGLQEAISPEQGPMSLACGRLPRKSVPGLASSGRSPCHFGWLVRNARRNGRVPRSRARHLGRCRHQAQVPIKGWSPCRWQIVPGAVGFMSCWQIVPGASAPRRLEKLLGPGLVTSSE